MDYTIDIDTYIIYRCIYVYHIYRYMHNYHIYIHVYIYSIIYIHNYIHIYSQCKLYIYMLFTYHMHRHMCEYKYIYIYSTRVTMGKRCFFPGSFDFFPETTVGIPHLGTPRSARGSHLPWGCQKSPDFLHGNVWNPYIFQWDFCKF
jgi:hypothetical protein